jgi:hypothetical protein
MPGPVKTNVPPSPLRWSVKRGAVEFGMSVMTLRKLINQASVEPGSDECYSTAELVGAIYGDLRSEKLRTQRELTKRYRLDNQIVEGSVLNRAELMKALSTIADAMTSRIMAAAVGREVKEDLLKELAGIPLVLEEVRRANSQLPRRDGQTDADDED